MQRSHSMCPPYSAMNELVAYTTRCEALTCTTVRNRDTYTSFWCPALPRSSRTLLSPRNMYCYTHGLLQGDGAISIARKRNTSTSCILVGPLLRTPPVVCSHLTFVHWWVRLCRSWLREYILPRKVWQLHGDSSRGAMMRTVAISRVVLRNWFDPIFVHFRHVLQTGGGLRTGRCRWWAPSSTEDAVDTVLYPYSFPGLVNGELNLVATTVLLLRKEISEKRRFREKYAYSILRTWFGAQN